MPSALSARTPAFIKTPSARLVDLPDYGPLDQLEEEFSQPCPWRDAFRRASFSRYLVIFTSARVPRYKFPDNPWLGIGEALIGDMTRVNKSAVKVWREQISEVDEQRA